MGKLGLLVGEIREFPLHKYAVGAGFPRPS
jgi:hypothetical protein